MKSFYKLSIFTVFLFLFSESMTESVLSSICTAVDNAKIKYIFLLLLLIISFFQYGKDFLNVEEFKKERQCFICALGILVLTTIYFQLQNGFFSRSIMEVIYIITPFIFASIVIKNCGDHIERFLDSVFYFCIFTVLFNGITRFTSFSDINFAESYSPFESALSSVFVYFEIYYLYKGDRKKTLIAAFFCFLSLKRLCVLKAVLIYIVFSRTRWRKINPIILWSTIAFFIVLPFILHAFYSGWGVAYLENYFQKDIRELTMDRSERAAIVIWGIEQVNYGLGTTLYLLGLYLREGVDVAEKSVLSLHCDILRIFYEGTIVSTIVYTISYFKMIFNRNLYVYLIMLHLFTEAIVNHFMIGAGTTIQWLIIYLCIYAINKREREQ